jgi:hypothetical protein
MCSLEQAPCFTTNEHTISMNSQRQDVLRRPSLQDLRRLKYTKQLFREVYRNYMNVQAISNSPKVRTYCLVRNIHLRGIVLLFGGLLAVAAIVTAATAAATA